MKHKGGGSGLSFEAVKKADEGKSGGLGWGKQFWLSAPRARPEDSTEGRTVPFLPPLPSEPCS